MMPQTDRRDSMNILVVDDEREIADVIELYLQNDQYSVFKFYTGQDALEHKNFQRLQECISLKYVLQWLYQKYYKDSEEYFPLVTAGNIVIKYE